MSDNYDKVSLLLPMNGANNGTVFTDWSPVPKTVTVFASAKTSTVQFKYYDSSAYFDGTDDYIQYDDSDAWHFGSGDFTIEFWICPNSVAGNLRILGQRASGTVNYSWVIGTFPNTDLYFGYSTDGTSATLVQRTHGMSATTWHHVAYSRNGANLRIFVDGTQIGATFDISTQSIFNSTTSLKIGAFNDSPTGFYGGYMQDLRITKGAALYTANFTPARLIGTISNAAVGADKILDINGDPAERTVFAVPRSAPVRIFSGVSSASGEFEIQAPAGVDHSVVALADEATLYNDIVARVIPE